MNFLPPSININLIIIFLILTGCYEVDQHKKAQEEILELHQRQRDFHFNKDAAAFAELLGENHISVNRGKISKPTKEENKNRFENYFGQVEFEIWDDLTPPIIQFSDDYSMAYTIVDKAVVLRYQDDEGQTQRDSTHFAWLAVYQKIQNEWKVVSVGSTNAPTVEF